MGTLLAGSGRLITHRNKQTRVRKTWVWCDLTLSIIKLLTVRSWRSDANTVHTYFTLLNPKNVTFYVFYFVAYVFLEQ